MDIQSGTPVEDWAAFFKKAEMNGTFHWIRRMPAAESGEGQRLLQAQSEQEPPGIGRNFLS